MPLSEPIRWHFCNLVNKTTQRKTKPPVVKGTCDGIAFTVRSGSLFKPALQHR